ncbi:MAG TPA: TetR family transcriptional regulator [Acidimicrobiia bacterium]|nr:TetR family transcriptional regulator [Acidimicrobiia bacterium]
MILAAARRQFAAHGYEKATIRGIAAEAEVDPALVHHYFDTKEQLFAAAVDFPAVPTDVIASIAQMDREKPGDVIPRTVLEIWEADITREQTIGLLRSATTNEAAATMLMELLTQTVRTLIAEAGDTSHTEFRVALVASQVLGLGIARHVLGLEPLASASTEEVANAVVPALQCYLTEQIDLQKGEHG